MVTALVGGYEEVGDICFCRKKKQQKTFLVLISRK